MKENRAEYWGTISTSSVKRGWKKLPEHSWKQLICKTNYCVCVRPFPPLPRPTAVYLTEEQRPPRKPSEISSGRTRTRALCSCCRYFDRNSVPHWRLHISSHCHSLQKRHGNSWQGWEPPAAESVWLHMCGKERRKCRGESFFFPFLSQLHLKLTGTNVMQGVVVPHLDIMFPLQDIWIFLLQCGLLMNPFVATCVAIHYGSMHFLEDTDKSQYSEWSPNDSSRNSCDLEPDLVGHFTGWFLAPIRNLCFDIVKG